MATLDDLDLQSIEDMSEDEAIELLRQIRLGRRITKQSTTRKVTASTKKKAKEPTLTPELAAQLLAILGE